MGMKATKSPAFGISMMIHQWNIYIYTSCVYIYITYIYIYLWYIYIYIHHIYIKAQRVSFLTRSKPRFVRKKRNTERWKTPSFTFQNTSPPGFSQLPLKTGEIQNKIFKHHQHPNLEAQVSKLSPNREKTNPLGTPQGLANPRLSQAQVQFLKQNRGKKTIPGVLPRIWQTPALDKEQGLPGREGRVLSQKLHSKHSHASPLLLGQENKGSASFFFDA